MSENYELEAIRSKLRTVTEIKEFIKEVPMKEENRIIAVMRICNFNTFEEIAEQLALDPRTVKRRFYSKIVPKMYKNYTKIHRKRPCN